MSTKKLVIKVTSADEPRPKVIGERRSSGPHLLGFGASGFGEALSEVVTAKAPDEPPLAKTSAIIAKNNSSGASKLKRRLQLMQELKATVPVQSGENLNSTASYLNLPKGHTLSGEQFMFDASVVNESASDSDIDEDPDALCAPELLVNWETGSLGSDDDDSEEKPSDLETR